MVFLSKFSAKEAIKEHCDTLTNIMLELKDDNEALLEEIKEMKTEVYKDKQLQEVSEQLEKMKNDYYRGFPITEEEDLAIQEWQNGHDVVQHRNYKHYHGCSGGGYSYTFYPTGLGTSAICKCEACAAAATKYAYEDGTYDKKKYAEYMKRHNGLFEFQKIG